jgi:16S rRNA processing protein RimM
VGLKSVNDRPDHLEHVDAGRVLGTHGVAGEIRVAVVSDVPERFDAGQTVYVQGKSYCIASTARPCTDQVILLFYGLNSLFDAQRMVGQSVTVPAVMAPELPQGEYYHFQLIGLQVFTEEWETLGVVTEILRTGSNDVYVISGHGGDILVPALVDVIRKIDLAHGLMVVRLMEGLR